MFRVSVRALALRHDHWTACAGHCYYFLEDVYPRITGRRPLKTPGVIKALFPEAGIGFMRTQPAAPQPAFPAPGVVPPPGAQR